VSASGIFAAITSTSSRGISSSSAAKGGMTDLLSSSDMIGDISNINISRGSFATAKNINTDALREALKERRGEKTTGIDIVKQDVGKTEGVQIVAEAKVTISSEPAKLQGESAGQGTRSMDAINQVMTRYENRIKRIYELMLKRDPMLGGKLIVQFTIQPDGSVTDVIVNQSTTNNPTFDKRVLSEIQKMEFSPIEGGSPVEVTFPFVFSSMK